MRVRTWWPPPRAPRWRSESFPGARRRQGEPRVSSRSQRQKGDRIAPVPFSCLVRLAGIEPTTPWFVAKYSIQLSYSRKTLQHRKATLATTACAGLASNGETGAAGRNRTHDPLVRSQVLYPAELQPQKLYNTTRRPSRPLHAPDFHPTVKLVRLAGIEPTTPWFVAKYSIQLSYSRKTSTIITTAAAPSAQLLLTAFTTSDTPSGISAKILVRLAGIEPTTPWFVAKYSIQLSYSRIQQRSVFYSIHYGLEMLNFHLSNPSRLPGTPDTAAAAFLSQHSLRRRQDYR